MFSTLQVSPKLARAARLSMSCESSILQNRRDFLKGECAAMCLKSFACPHQKWKRIMASSY